MFSFAAQLRIASTHLGSSLKSHGQLAKGALELCPSPSSPMISVPCLRRCGETVVPCRPEIFLLGNQPMSTAAAGLSPLPSKKTTEGKYLNCSPELMLVAVAGFGLRPRWCLRYGYWHASQPQAHEDKGVAGVNPFLLLPVSVVSTVQSQLGSHGSPRVLRANATHQVHPCFSLRMTEKGRSFFAGDEQAVCPYSAQNMPPAARCHVCEQRWHRLPEA